MEERKEMKPQEKREMQARTEREVTLRPPVDIYEEPQGITLKADLPGVSHDRLEIQIDGDTLTIEGRVSVDMPEGMEALYADVRATRYHRNFTLSREIDTDNIGAEMKEGVLTLTLPKRPEHQPHRIEVRTS